MGQNAAAYKSMYLNLTAVLNLLEILVVVSASVKDSVCVDTKFREASLDILICISRLPHPELLLQYRPVVLKSLMPALDDPRRCVRKAAVKCRNTWSLLG